MGWMRWTGKALVVTGEIMKAEGFEEWADAKGRAIVEKYASDEFKGFRKKQKAKKEIRDTFVDFLAHEGFSNKLNSEITFFFEDLGVISDHIESNQYAAENQVYVVPRLIAHDRLDERFRKSLIKSGDIAYLNERLAKSFPNIDDDFLDFFVPRFRSALLENIESWSFSSQNKWKELGQNWWLVGCEKTSRWVDGNDGGHYLALHRRTMHNIAKSLELRVSSAIAVLSVQIFDLGASRRTEIVDNLTERLAQGVKYYANSCPEEIRSEISKS